jgi:hypothetical protein
MWEFRSFPTLRRLALCLALLCLVLSTSASAGTAAKPGVIMQINNLAAAGSRVVFEGSVSRGKPGSGNYDQGKLGLWSQRFGSRKLELISTTTMCSDEATYALGATGMVGCLDTWAMITQVGFDVYVLLGDGTVKQVVSLNFEGGDFDVPVTEGVPAIFGDGNFLGYLDVSDSGLVRLFRITPSGQAKYVADLTGLSSCNPTDCGSVVVGSGNIVIREFRDSEVHVFTTAGKPLATFSANPAGPVGSVAIHGNRIVAVANGGRLAVYSLHGKLVHSYRAHAIRGQVTTYYGYAAYMRGGKSVHVLKLSSGKDREIARVRSAGCAALSLQRAGLVVACQDQSQPNIRYVPMKKIRAKLG